MYAEIYNNFTGKKLGTVTEKDGDLEVDSVSLFVLEEVAYAKSREDFTPQKFFKKLSRRFETATTYIVYNDEGQRIHIMEDDTVVISKTKGE
jgi:sporulation protein YlmC with PRC-barrel domain